MPSNLACVGLAADDEDAFFALLDATVPSAVLLGETRDVRVMRWEDPSGARLVYSIGRGGLLDLLPSFADAPGALLAAVESLDDDLAIADVVDADGEVVTRLTLEMEQRRFLARARPPAGPASLVALGVDVATFADAAAFAAAPASLVDPDADPDEEPPAHFRERGWTWPPRMASESFISYGALAGDADGASARLAGVVLAASVRSNALTGQPFVSARVRSAGFEATVCFPAEGPGTAPTPGAVVSGEVFMVGSMDSIEAGPVRRGRLWRRR